MYRDEKKCYTCNKITEHINGRCSVCLNKKYELDKKAEGDRWNSLSIEQKLDELKYRLDNNKRYDINTSRLGSSL